MFKALGMGKEHLKSDEGGRTMSKTLGMRWLVVAAGAAMLLVLGAACTKEVEVPGETIVVEKEVVKTVEVPGETIVVEKEVVKTVEIEVPGKTVTVTKEVIKEVEIPGETVVVTKEVIKEVEVPGETVVVTKEVLKVVEVRQGYVTDPTTGKVVSAPQYGGTITATRVSDPPHGDVYFHHAGAGLISGVIERLTIADWALDRDVFNYRTTYMPDFVWRGHLAESWNISPDGLTYTFPIRKGVNWHDKPPMNGRELTAKDIEYNLHRYLGLGSGYTEPAAYWASNPLALLPWESITATDKWTLVFKLTKVDPDALRIILKSQLTFTYPPEVIEKYGDMKDWRNVVGTGPFELTDWVEGSSITWTKNPNYWGFDEKYPENRLPYVDQLRQLIMPDAATRLAALRSAKIDLLAMFLGAGHLTSMDQVDSLKKTNPELLMEPFSYRSLTSWPINSSRPPFDDARVSHAMQMALDLETINTLYFGGHADTTPQGWLGAAMVGYVTPFEEWPAEVKGYYTYDPEGAEALLDEAGYPRGADGIRLKIVLDVGLPHFDVAYNELAASYWAEIGVDVEIREVEWAAFFPTVPEGNFDMFTFISGYEVEPLMQIIQLTSDTTANAPHVRDPVYNAMVADVQAADTNEERKRLTKLVDMYIIEKHWFIWGSRVPLMNVLQPWVIGFNGETELGNADRVLIASRLWIDQELKEAMGY